MTARSRGAALGTRSQDASGRVEAARALLQRPIVTVSRDPETMVLIRTHATALKTMFASQLGYTLIIESSFARLVKSPLEAESPTRGVTRSNGGRLRASSYALLTLACAALMAPGIGEQVLISSLVAQIRSDAAARDITLSDAISDRRRLVAALGVLVDWGVLVETDGSVSQWSEGNQDEALLTICRPLLPHLMARAIGPHDTVDDVLAVGTEQPRRRLRRRLVEDPFVHRRELSGEELDVLSRERTELTNHLEDNFGLTLEVREEGALAYDTAGKLSDIEFPGSGSLRQATLLLIAELIVAEEPSRAVPWPVVDHKLSELCGRYAKAWKGEYVDSPATLRDDVVGLIEDLKLGRSSEDGLTLFAPAARYRPITTAKGVS